MEPPATVRGHFGYTAAFPEGEVEGRLVKAAQLTVRSFNFGQHWRTPGVRDVGYTVTLPMTFVKHVLKRELSTYVQDCIAYPNEDDRLEIGLRRKNWPDAEVVLEDPELCGLALNWIAHDCLLEWLGDGQPEVMPGFVINTVEFSERQGDVVPFLGKARDAGQSVKYQDV